MNTQKIITDAMLHLMDKIPYEKITTQMILDQASVSRSTFYRYYRDKYDLVNQYYKNHIIDIAKKHTRWDECLVDIYRFIGENRTCFTKVLKTDGPHSFWDFYYRFCYNFRKECFLSKNERNELTEKEKVLLEGATMGAIFMVRRWLENGAKTSPELMAEWVSEMMPDSFRQYVDISGVGESFDTIEL